MGRVQLMGDRLIVAPREDRGNRGGGGIAI